MKSNHLEPMIVSRANCLIQSGGDNGTYQNLPVAAARQQ